MLNLLFYLVVARLDIKGVERVRSSPEEAKLITSTILNMPD